MRRNLFIAVLGGAAVLLAAAFWFAYRPGNGRSLVSGGAVSNQISAATNSGVTNQSILDLRKLLVDNYHSTNYPDVVTCAVGHQLIAERLKTNDEFLAWATNIAISAIMRFATNGSVPVYGAAGLTSDALHFYKVTADGQVGLDAEAIFDPHPDNEGELLFIVEGGVKPTLQLVENKYRKESYQLDPESWKSSPRHVQRMDWSMATIPLDKNQVDLMAHNAFREMTGFDLNSPNLTAKILTEKIFNPNAVHPEVTVTGNLNAKIFTPKDYVYPFATFQYGSSNFMRITLEGEMVQTSSGKGEFVSLFALVSKTSAIYELGEKFFGQGTWEQDMLDQVKSMNDDERGAVYKRVFAN